MMIRASGADAVNALSELPFFSELGAETCADFAVRARTKHLDEGQMLFRSGDVCASIFVVLRGAVRAVEFTDTGRRVTIELHTTGDVFGLSALANCRHYPHSAYALADSDLIVADVDDAKAVMFRHAEFTQAILNVLVGRVQIAHARIKQLAVESVETRLARALLHFSGKLGAPLDGTAGTVIEANQQELAEYCATTVESVNRQLRAWERVGLIEVSRSRIAVLRSELITELIGD